MKKTKKLAGPVAEFFARVQELISTGKLVRRDARGAVTANLLPEAQETPATQATPSWNSSAQEKGFDEMTPTERLVWANQFSEQERWEIVAAAEAECAALRESIKTREETLKIYARIEETEGAFAAACGIPVAEIHGKNDAEIGEIIRAAMARACDLRAGLRIGNLGFPEHLIPSAHQAPVAEESAALVADYAKITDPTKAAAFYASNLAHRAEPHP